MCGGVVFRGGGFIEPWHLLWDNLRCPARRFEIFSRVLLSEVSGQFS